MKYNVPFFLFIILFFFPLIVFGADSFSSKVSDSCNYLSEYTECKEANENGSPRSIEDFVCIDSDNDEDILYQIILDKEFKKVDEKVNEYLEELQQNKDYYFGPEAKETFLEGVDEIEEIFSFYGFYGQKYVDVCKASSENGVVQQTIDCLGGENSAIKSSDFFSTDSDCMRLIATKLEINKQVAYDILKINKHTVRNDIQKRFQQDQRTKYDTLLEIIMVNVGYLERIRKKWPSKTRTAH